MKASSESGEWATRIVRGEDMGSRVRAARGAPARIRPGGADMRAWIVAGALAALALGGGAMAEPADGPIAAGTEVPDFRLNDHEGKGVRLSDFRGKRWVALAFFPKAMTGG